MRRRHILHSEVIRHLCCPICRRELAQATADAPVRCPSGHSFDPARQGYVPLFAAAQTHPGDSAAMVAARATFLTAGHFATITSAVRDIAAAAWPGGLVLDAGAGTGHHLASVLDGLPAAYGLAVDSSKAAARRSANAHARADAIVADVWRPLPVRDSSIGVLTDIFAPRNAAEFARILRPDGVLIVVTPAVGHLAELVDALDLLRVDPVKSQRLAAAFDALFQRAASRPYQWIMELDHDDVGTLVGMGPSAWHTDPAALSDRIAALPSPVRVTASVVVAAYRPRK